MSGYAAYILECSDGSYYTGITNDLELRLKQHQNGTQKESYTYSRRPVQLKFCEFFGQAELAIQFEKQIKGWSRKKKQAIISDNWEKLPELSKCLNSSSHVNLSFDSAQDDFDMKAKEESSDSEQDDIDMTAGEKVSKSVQDNIDISTKENSTNSPQGNSSEKLSK